MFTFTRYEIVLLRTSLIVEVGLRARRIGRCVPYRI